MGLVSLAVAPALIGAMYLFIRDKYEKEPIGLLFLGLLYGVYATFVILCLGAFLDFLFPQHDTGLYSAFIASAGVEEIVKFLFLYFLIWRNKNFNEPFDGVVYSVFISLGFALFENVIYVLHPTLGGFKTAIARALFSVPGHGLFGVMMGYYFALAKFTGYKKYLWMAFWAPYLFHSGYNLILFEKTALSPYVFIVYVIIMWRFGLSKMKILLQNSPFQYRQRDQR